MVELQQVLYIGSMRLPKQRLPPRRQLLLHSQLLLILPPLPLLLATQRIAPEHPLINILLILQLQIAMLQFPTQSPDLLLLLGKGPLQLLHLRDVLSLRRTGLETSSQLLEASLVNFLLLLLHDVHFCIRHALLVIRS